MLDEPFDLPAHPPLLVTLLPAPVRTEPDSEEAWLHGRLPATRLPSSPIRRRTSTPPKTAIPRTMRYSVVPVPSDVLLTPAMPEFAHTGLRVASVLRLHRIVTVSTAIVRRRLGVLGAGTQNQLAQKLRALFAI